MNKKLQILLLAVLITISYEGFSQASSKSDSIYFITMKDGTQISGTLNQRDERNIKIQTRSIGIITIPVDSVKQIDVQPATAHKDGKYWFPKPNATRYFMGPSAIPLGKGEGYFQNSELFLCTVNFGVTKNISIGGGFDVLTPFIQDAGGPIALANLKAGFKVARNLHLAAATLLLRAPVADDEKDWSIFLLEYGLLTYGTYDANFTIGVGYGLKNGSPVPAPSFTLSGMARVSPRFSFITENWISPNTNYQYNPSTGENEISKVAYKALFGYGMRFMSPKIAVDFGFINSKDIAQSIAIGVPYVDFVVKF